MSQENVETVRPSNALFNAGDWDALIELFHPDVELRDRCTLLMRPKCGPEALSLVLGAWTEVYDEFEADVHEYIDADPWVICDTRWHGKVTGSDMPIDLHVADAYEVNDGKIIRVINSYSDVAAALKAVGLSE
jgi:ketosteroid isomerase-like protein